MELREQLAEAYRFQQNSHHNYDSKTTKCLGIFGGNKLTVVHISVLQYIYLQYPDMEPGNPTHRTYWGKKSPFQYRPGAHFWFKSDYENRYKYVYTHRTSQKFGFLLLKKHFIS